MVDWTFKDALVAIQSPHSIPISVLQSAGGLRLGDICFTKIQTTLCMWTIPIAVLEKWVADGSFNLECMAEGDYSHTTAILILLNPNTKGTVLESTSVGLIVQQRMGPVGQINTIMKLIKYAHSLMKVEWQSSNPTHRTICTIVGDYGRHMAFTTDPLFCMAYPLSFVCQDDPTQMTFRSHQNHPVSFTVDVLYGFVFTSYSHGIVPCVNMQWTDIMGASLFPGECIFCLTSFHRSLFHATMWYHTVIPR